MKRKQGDPRSASAKAKIALWVFRYSEYIQVNQFGYTYCLYRYGRVSWDAANQLKKSLPESAYKELSQILNEDDARGEN